MFYGVNARELYEALAWYEGTDPYETIIVPWLDRAQDGYRDWLATAAEDGSARGVRGDDPLPPLGSPWLTRC